MLSTGLPGLAILSLGGGLYLLHNSVFVRGEPRVSHGHRTFSGPFCNRALLQTSGRGVVGSSAAMRRRIGNSPCPVKPRSVKREQQDTATLRFLVNQNQNSN
jgi:hypothetical protein